MLGPFATTSRLTPIHQMSLAVLSRAACTSMSTTTTTTTTRDRGDRYGPMEWAQSHVYHTKKNHNRHPFSQRSNEAFHGRARLRRTVDEVRSCRRCCHMEATDDALRLTRFRLSVCPSVADQFIMSRRRHHAPVQSDSNRFNRSPNC